MKKKIKKQAKKKAAAPAAPIKVEQKETEYSALKVKQLALVVADKEAQLEIRKMTPAKIDLLRKTVAKDATPDEFGMFMTYAVRSGLDPFARQIYFVKRGDNRTGESRGTIQVGIDGLRSVAERTGAYAGSDEPIFEPSTDEKSLYPGKAKITVYKMVQGQRVSFVGVAKWSEFYPGEKLGFMWRKMPETMLAKCAEGQALRKAFPQVMAGMYVHEEMARGNVGQKAVVEETAGLSDAEKFKLSKDKIAECENASTLKQWREKILANDKMADEPKQHLISLIDEKLQRFTSKNA